MNNREWLYSLDVADLADWFDSEHDGTLDGDTAALNAKIAELTAERDTLQGALDIAVQNESKLEAERELYREALSQLLDTVTDGMGKVSAILDNYDEGMA